MRTRLPRLAGLGAATLLLLGAAYDETRFAVPSAAPRMSRPAQGVLMAEDFSDRGLEGWSPDQEGVWTAWRGMLRADLPDQKQLRSLIHTGDTSWTDVAVDVDMCMMRGVDKGLVVRVRGTAGMGVDVRGGGYQDVVMYLNEWPMGRAPATNANGTWNHLRVEARGHRYRVFVNGELKLDRMDNRAARPAGSIALPAYTGGVGKCTVYYDNVVVTALPKATAAAER